MWGEIEDEKRRIKTNETMAQRQQETKNDVEAFVDSIVPILYYQFRVQTQFQLLGIFF
jgi:hypothetical protein